MCFIIFIKYMEFINTVIRSVSAYFHWDFHLLGTKMALVSPIQQSGFRGGT